MFHLLNFAGASARQGSKRTGLSVLLVAGLFLLASCGGDDAPGVVTPPAAVPKLSVSLTDASGSSSNVVTVAAPLKASATLLDANGRAVANSLVQFALTFTGSSTPASILPTSGSGVTDANGKFMVTLVPASESAEGGGTITATAVNEADAPSAKASFQVVATAPPPQAPAVTLVLTDASTGVARSTLNRSAPLTATATLRDGRGRPVANSLIQYSLAFAAGTPVAVLSPSSGNGITDVNGKFSLTLIAANQTAEGSGTITAKAVDVTDAKSATASFQVEATAPPAVAPAVALALTDPATGAARNSLTLASPVNATATVLDASNRPVPNSLIQFALSTSGGGAPVASFSPSSGTGITDANGKFTVSLQASGLTTQGAGTVKATAVNEKDAPSASQTFQVGATNITLGNVTVTPPEIDPLQTSSITVQVTGVPPSVPVSVRFTSSCATSGLATLPASAVTVNGVATAVYTDKGCSGRDSITISADGASSIPTSIRIREAPPVAIQFVSATPEVISVAGTGGQPASTVVFKVVNAAQLPVANLPVTLSLSTSVGGVTLDGQSGAITKQTSQDGTVRVSVIAGSQPGPVRVLATAAGGLSTLSSVLTIQTGLPVQNRFSISFETFNIEGWNVDGTRTSVTIRAADRIGNPVPNGTTINFRTSGSAIEPSCQTANGACSVNFRSQANRPSSGRVAVLAWAIGEEAFLDSNGNNRYDSGETFGDLGDAFVDASLDGTYQPTEEFIAFNAAATASCSPNAFSAPGRPNSCDGIWGIAHVRASGVVVLSGSTAFAPNLPSLVRLSGPSNTCEGAVSFTLTDVNGNPMPAGTTVAAKVNGGTTEVFGSPVVNTIDPTGVTITLSVPAEIVAGSDPEVARCQGQGSKLLVISVTTPLGTTTNFGVPVIY